MERFIVSASNGGFELSGLILQTHDEAPYVVRYAIQVDQSWRTRKVEVELADGVQRSLALSADAAGRWMRDGQRLGELDDCSDVDLEWSPSTNTLPIRRLTLATGESKGVSAVWVGFASLEAQRLDQSYERLEDRRYRYRSGLFTADLAVDEHGIVLQYGVNWKAVAGGGELH